MGSGSFPWEVRRPRARQIRQTGGVITVELAVRLLDAGLAWHPEPGDRFVIPEHDLDGEVFVISNMTIDTAQVGSRHLVRFNGTTEWALDSVDADVCVWLPHEAQLRALLGPGFRSLAFRDGEYVVTTAQSRFAARDAECAYALALVEMLG